MGSILGPWCLEMKVLQVLHVRTLHRNYPLSYAVGSQASQSQKLIKQCSVSKRNGESSLLNAQGWVSSWAILKLESWSTGITCALMSHCSSRTTCIWMLAQQDSGPDIVITGNHLKRCLEAICWNLERMSIQSDLKGVYVLLQLLMRVFVQALLL